MLLDCAVIGGGPAGLNAALVLGRSRRNVVLVDDNNPRNAVTRESHGFITRDGVHPGEFRKLAHQDIRKYPSVQFMQDKVLEVRSHRGIFELAAEKHDIIQARKIILAAGLREILPNIERIRDYYGKSLFNCPYCDGWELRDKPLIAIAENQHAFHLAKTVCQWSRDLIVCTNGVRVLTEEQKAALRNKGIPFIERKIKVLAGEGGLLEQVVFEDGIAIARKGGFVSPQLQQSTSIGQTLGCKMNELGGIVKDELGRTSIKGVYAAGDTSGVAPSQLIIAAAEGSRAAIGVNSDLIEEDFH